jgi:hypothetical protein
VPIDRLIVELRQALANNGPYVNSPQWTTEVALQLLEVVDAARLFDIGPGSQSNYDRATAYLKLHQALGVLAQKADGLVASSS